LSVRKIRVIARRLRPGFRFAQPGLLFRRFGAIDALAAAWASDTVMVSHDAFKGLIFSKGCQGHWLMKFANRKAYLKNANAIKEVQLAKGGARLAQLLNAIWP